MYLKGIICLLLMTNILSGINEKTLKRIDGCCIALKNNDFKEFENLLLKDEFYLYHLFDPIIEHDKVTSFYALLQDYAKKSSLPLTYTLLLNQLKSETINSSMPMQLEYSSWRGDHPKDTWLFKCWSWRRCCIAIERNNVRKLHELLKDNDFYKTSAGFEVTCEFYEQYPQYPELGCAHLVTKHFDLLNFAIYHMRPNCIRLISYLQGKCVVPPNQLTYIFHLYQKSFSPKMMLALTRTLFCNNRASIMTQSSISKRTPIYYAPNAAIVEYLIQQGSDINQTDEEGVTPLMKFSGESTLESTNNLLCLLNHNAANNNEKNNMQDKIDMQDNMGDTALHHAVKYERITHIKLLLEYGADATIQSSSGSTPLDKASSNIWSWHCIKEFPNTALVSKTFVIDPFKYKNQMRAITHYSYPPKANNTNLLRHREMNGEKHTYRLKKKKQDDSDDD